MAISREAIYSALWAKVAGLAGIVTASRRLRHWDDVSPEEQPALFQTQKEQAPEQKYGLPPKWRLYADLYVYVNSGQDPLAVPAIALNEMIDAIEAAIAADPVSGVQTLGGLASHCWINGKIETDEGVLGAQAVAIIPIEILAV
jgi:hypothetical protein